MSLFIIPEELLLEILLYVPTTCLGDVLVVCKRIARILCSDEFLRKALIENTLLLNWKLCTSKQFLLHDLYETNQLGDANRIIYKRETADPIRVLNMKSTWCGYGAEQHVLHLLEKRSAQSGSLPCLIITHVAREAAAHDFDQIIHFLTTHPDIDPFYFAPNIFAYLCGKEDIEQVKTCFTTLEEEWDDEVLTEHCLKGFITAVRSRKLETAKMVMQWGPFALDKREKERLFSHVCRDGDYEGVRFFLTTPYLCPERTFMYYRLKLACEEGDSTLFTLLFANGSTIISDIFFTHKSDNLERLHKLTTGQYARLCPEDPKQKEYETILHVLWGETPSHERWITLHRALDMLERGKNKRGVQQVVELNGWSGTNKRRLQREIAARYEKGHLFIAKTLFGILKKIE
uniref:F-box domain-containing protein n=1 Tax=Pithovirus LCPAC304 TaxID=2506594 RepID=A0A481Z946_9VIRU|nr:MAG: hypothetical protein LCPAC304_04730 [Pithovirus LCPAC304]